MLMLEGAVSRRVQAASGSWRREGDGFSPKSLQKEHSSADNFNFCTSSPYPEVINLYCFKPLSIW